MVDRLSKEKRSWNMSRIRNRDTIPERKVRSILHAMGYRFRLHRADLPGKPDIVLPRYKLVIFVNGCFWHRHKGCKYAYMPKSRQDFWMNKFNANIERDKQVKHDLIAKGWMVATVWECEIRDEDGLSERLKNILRNDDDNMMNN